jgi:hypothetical protein
LRDIARHVALSKDALARHKPYVSQIMAKAAEAREMAHANNLVEQLRQLTADATRIAPKAEKAKQYNAAMAGVREMARIVELVAKLTGQLDEGTRVNVLIAQQARAGEQLMG